MSRWLGQCGFLWRDNGLDFLLTKGLQAFILAS